MDLIFLELKDMKTDSCASVWDVISLSVKNKGMWCETKELYLKEGDPLLLTPHNYIIIKNNKNKWSLFINMWHYEGILYKEILPKWFEKWDSLNLIVRFVKNSVKKKRNERDIDRKFVSFDCSSEDGLVKAKSRTKASIKDNNIKIKKKLDKKKHKHSKSPVLNNEEADAA